MAEQVGTVLKPRSAGLVEIAMLFALATLWSSSFGFIKVAVESIPPSSVTAGRLLLATVVIVAIAWMRGLRIPNSPGLWRRFFLIGLFGNALPFTLIGWGEMSIDSGLAAILMAVMPLATLLLAHIFTTDERMNPARIAGVALGFGGVALLIGPAALKGLGDEAIRQSAVAAGAVCYAIATVIAKGMPKTPHLVSSAGTLIASSVLILPLSLFYDQPWTLAPSAGSIGSVVVLGLFPTALAIVLYFNLLERTGATFIALNNYLIPGMGVLWGILFLGEVLTGRSLAALGVIMLGVAFTRIGMRRGSGTGLPNPP